MSTIKKDSFINLITVIFGGTGGGGTEELSRGAVQVQRLDRVIEIGDDGKETVLAATPHRHVVEAGADVSGEDERVQRIAAVAWSDEKIAALTEAMSVTRGKRIAELERQLDDALNANADLATERDAALRKVSEEAARRIEDLGKLQGEAQSLRADNAVAIAERDAARAQLASVEAHNKTLQQLVEVKAEAGPA